MPRFRSAMASTPSVGVGMGLGSLTSSRPPAAAAVHVAPAPLPLLLPLPPAPGEPYCEPGSQATRREAKVRAVKLMASVDVRYMFEDGARAAQPRRVRAMKDSA